MCSVTPSVRRDFLRLILGSGVWMAMWMPGISVGRNGDHGDHGDDILTMHPWLYDWIEQDGFEREELHRLLAPIEPNQRVLDLMDRQAEALPYYKYRKLLINNRVIAKGRTYRHKYRTLLRRVTERYDVPASVIVALWGIESRFGGNTGSYPVLQTLFTLATGYPRRAPFFREQLRQFLLLCREERWDPTTLKGSYAGAMGQVQMIPGTLRRYAVDFNNDGKRDVFHQTEDVLGSIAAFLQGHGWRSGAPYTAQLPTAEKWSGLVTPSLEEMTPWRDWHTRQAIHLPANALKPKPEEPTALIMLEESYGKNYHLAFNNFKVITRWNRSRRFAMVVYELANAIEKGGL